MYVRVDCSSSKVDIRASHHMDTDLAQAETLYPLGFFVAGEPRDSESISDAGFDGKLRPMSAQLRIGDDFHQQWHGEC
jgi:hypothetical protein